MIGGDHVEPCAGSGVLQTCLRSQLRSPISVPWSWNHHSAHLLVAVKCT